jgi:hypothetical protein
MKHGMQPQDFDQILRFFHAEAIIACLVTAAVRR